jgi:cyclic pyranopterin phosphate synthase
MPKEVFGGDYPFLPKDRLLTDAEILRLASVFLRLGVVKFRITGGEPLLRDGLPAIIEGLKRNLGAPDVALTTNGTRLAPVAADLARAGLDRVNVSLDGLGGEVVGAMNGIGADAGRTLAGIDAALAAGLRVKLNMVVVRGRNDAEVPAVLGWARERRLPLRFIEFMDAGNHNAWDPSLVVPAAELLDRIQKMVTMEPVGPAYRGEVARRWRLADGVEIGFITSVSQPFCGDCNRARVSADGRLFTCLFAAEGRDLLGPLRAGVTDGELTEIITGVWQRRQDRYSEERSRLVAAGEARRKAEMSYLGG